MNTTHLEVESIWMTAKLDGPQLDEQLAAVEASERVGFTGEG